MSVASRGTRTAGLRLLAVAVVLAAFAFWSWSSRPPEHVVDSRLRLPWPAGTQLEPAVRLAGEEREALVLPCGRALQFRVLVPGADAVLRFHDGHVSEQPELSLRLVAEDGERLTVAQHATVSSRWTARRVPLPVRAGEVVTLELAALDGGGAPGLGTIYLADLVLESAGRRVEPDRLPLRLSGLEADLLARRGSELLTSPPGREQQRADMAGPPCLAVPRDDVLTLGLPEVPPGARLKLVVRVARRWPEGVATSGRLVVQANGEVLTDFVCDPPGAELAAQFELQADLAAFAGGPLDLALRLHGAENLFVGLIEAWITTERSVARRVHAPERPGRNVLLVTIEALRADRLGSFGYDRGHTPVLDDLAARGGRWERVLAPSSWALPNAVTLFTGVSPLSHGVGLRAGVRLSSRLAGFGQTAAWNGISTASFGNSPVLSPETGVLAGFERQVVRRVPADVLVEEALDWLVDHDDFPWLLHLNFGDPAHPYEPLPRDVAALARSEADPALVARLRGLDSRPGLAEQLAAELGPLYDAEVAGVDRALGTLLAELERRGRLEHTLVAVVGLSGEEFFEHRGRSHGQTLFDEVVRVPVILAGPGVRGADGRPFVSSEPVELVDISVLLASLGGLSVRGGLQGRLPPPFGPRLPDPTAHAVLRPVPGVTSADLDAARARHWLWIFDHASARESLYHLPSDPGALNDLLAPRATAPPGVPDVRAQADSLSRSFREWQRTSLKLSAAQAVPVPERR